MSNETVLRPGGCTCVGCNCERRAGGERHTYSTLLPVFDVLESLRDPDQQPELSEKRRTEWNQPTTLPSSSAQWLSTCVLGSSQVATCASQPIVRPQASTQGSAMSVPATQISQTQEIKTKALHIYHDPPRMHSEALGYHNQSIDGQNWEMVKSMAHPTFQAFLGS